MTTEEVATSPDGLGKLNLEAMKAPRDLQWTLRKARPTQFADAKHAPGTDYAPKEPTAETLASFVDKHSIALLSKTEQGKAFLEQLKGGVLDSCEGWDG